MFSQRHPLMVALVFAAWTGCALPEDEQELTDETARPLVFTQYLGGYRSNVGAPGNWWQYTGQNAASIHFRFKFACQGGLIQPWAGHAGLGCGGDGTYWSQSLVPGCPYGSLVGKVGNGTPFCIGNNTGWYYPWATGPLYLAFNDGGNFEDNGGYWMVQVEIQLDAPKIKMPFAGYIDKNAWATPPTHELHDGDEITEWSTDVFAANGPGTDVVFRVTDGVTGEVMLKVKSCPDSTGGGKTLFIDLKQNGILIGRALYAHVGGTTIPAIGQTLSNGAVLGQTVPVPEDPIPLCYDVSDPADTHVHFELGTRKDTMGTTNKSCWATYSRDVLRDSTAKLGQFGLTGLSGDLRACP